VKLEHSVSHLGINVDKLSLHWESTAHLPLGCEENALTNVDYSMARSEILGRPMFQKVALHVQMQILLFKRSNVLKCPTFR
jgi:hypothetical protein